jgi:8-oxo-dGTP diphosphatase
MNDFNEDEFLNICKKTGSKGKITDVTIHYDTPSYFNRVKSVVQRDRRGEVVFCVLRPNGKAIAVTCADYPKGIYRIPTGGIGHNEEVIDALYREVEEELGLEVRIRQFGGVVRIRFEYGSESVMFYSYLFLLDEIGGHLLDDAIDDEISEIKEADAEELESIVTDLKNIRGKWHDWGVFRYTSTKAILDLLK